MRARHLGRRFLRGERSAECCQNRVLPVYTNHRYWMMGPDPRPPPMFLLSVRALRVLRRRMISIMGAAIIA